ncbi:MAG: tetratricopeptide repeat protein [Endomicrobiales bacterium]|nr:tetratricopeptide repeat protein [Endomicrobiales bacterium]
MNKKNRVALVLLITVLMSDCSSAMPAEAYRSYLRGLLAAKSGDSALALEEYQHAAELDENAVLVYRDLAYLYLQAGQTEKAMDAAGRLEANFGDDLQTQLYLGSFYLLAGRVEKARESWEKALKIDPQDESALLYLAAYHASDNQPLKAIAYWKKYLDKNPGSAEAYYQMGLSNEKLGYDKLAKEAYLKAVELKPEFSGVYVALAQLYEKEKKYETASKFYEKYLEIVPDNSTVLLYLGTLYFRMKDYAAAEETYLRAKKIIPEDTAVYFWLGVIAETKKDWEKAIENFEVIKTKEKNATVLTRLSYYYASAKRHKKSIKYLKEASELEPGNGITHYLLGIAYFDVKKYKKSEQSLLKALELDPDLDGIDFHIGILYDQWGKFDKGVPYLLKAIETNEDNSSALNYLGYSYAERNMKLDEAEKLVLSALKKDPDNGSYIDSLGWVYFRQGLFDKSYEKLSIASQKTKDPIISEHLGDVCMKLGKYAEAWDAYRDALALDPKNRKIRKKIKEIDRLVLPSTIQRKVLKRAEGNLLQIRSLKLAFALSGRKDDTNIRFAGIFNYSRPDKWRIDVLGSFLAPQAVVIGRGGEVSYLPRALETKLSPNAASAFRSMGDFFNADVTKAFDSDKTSISKKGKKYTYRQEKLLLEIDSRNGSVLVYSDGSLNMEFGGYKLVEGLYLPSRMRVYSKSDNFIFEVTLKSFVLNEKPKDGIFDPAAGESAGSTENAR